MAAKGQKAEDHRVISAEECEQITLWASKLVRADHIASLLGMCYTTFWEVRQRQPEVNEAYKRGQAQALLDLANHTYEKAMGLTDKGSSIDAIFLLKTRGKFKEVTHQITEHVGMPVFAESLEEYQEKQELARTRAANESIN